MEKAGAGAATLLPPGFHPGCIFWLPALVFAGIGNRTAYLAFLEFIAPFMVVVGGSHYDPATGRGCWEPLLYGLHQMQLRNKKRRRELGNLIKRFRSGAESLPDAVVLTTEEAVFSGVTV